MLIVTLGKTKKIMNFTTYKMQKIEKLLKENQLVIILQ